MEATNSALTEEMRKTIKALAMLLVTLTSRMKNTQIQIPPKEMDHILSQIHDILTMKFKIPQKMTDQLLQGLILRFSQVSETEDCLIKKFCSILEITLNLHAECHVEERLVVIILHKIIKNLMRSRKLGPEEKSNCIKVAVKILENLEEKSTSNLKSIFPGVISECTIQLKHWRSGKQIACGLLKFLDVFIKLAVHHFVVQAKNLSNISHIPASLTLLLKAKGNQKLKQPTTQMSGLKLALLEISKNLKNLLPEPKIAKALKQFSTSLLEILPFPEESSQMKFMLLQLIFLGNKFTQNNLVAMHYLSEKSLHSLMKYKFMARIRRLKKYLFLNLGLVEEKLIFFQLEFTFFTVAQATCYFNYEQLETVFQSLCKVLEVNNTKQLVEEETKLQSPTPFTDVKEQEQAKLFKIFCKHSQNPEHSFALFQKVLKILPSKIKQFIIDRSLTYIQDLNVKPEIKPNLQNELYIQVNIFNINLQIKSLVLLSNLVQEQTCADLDGIRALVCSKLAQYQFTAVLEFKAHSIYLYWLLKVLRITLLKNKDFVFIQNLEAMSYFFQFALHPQQFIKVLASHSLCLLAKKLKIEMKELVTYQHSALYEYLSYKLNELEFEQFPLKLILSFQYLVQLNSELTVRLGLEMIQKIEQKIDRLLRSIKNQTLLLALLNIVSSVVRVITDYFKAHPLELESSQYNKSNYLKHILLRIRHLIVPSRQDSRKPEIRKICYKSAILFKDMMYLLSRTPLDTEQKPYSFSAQDPNNVSIPNALRHIVYLLWEHIQALLQSYQDVALQRYGFDLLSQIAIQTEPDQNYFKSMKRFDTLLEPIISKTLQLRLSKKETLSHSTQSLIISMLQFLEIMSRTVINEELGTKLRHSLLQISSKQQLRVEVKQKVNHLIELFTYN